MSPRTPPLPPIQLLAAFEAAGRHGSFKLAASELHLTPSAISQQLRQLEDALGLLLFERKTRAITLTEAGVFYLGVARETLEVFRRGTARLRERHGRRTLRVSAGSAVAHDVMIPGLSDFHERHCGIDLCIETSSALVDPEHCPVDAAVRFGRGPWPGLVADELATMTASPVAAPSLLAKQPLASPEDFAAHTLLDVAAAPDHWSLVAAHHGFRIGRRLALDSYLSTLQAATHGAGIALGLFPMSSAWVHDGRLVAPLPILADDVAYHLVYRFENRERSEITLLRDWLRARFAALPPLRESSTPTASSPRGHPR